MKMVVHEQKKIDNRRILLLLTPSVAGVCMFLLLPNIDVLHRAFTQAATGEFVFLDNFRSVLDNEAFRLAGYNSFLFAAISLPILILGTLFLAMLLYEYVGKGSWTKTALLLPMAIPSASIVLTWKLLFHKQGIVNGVLDTIGFEPLNWMDSSAALWIVVGFFVWKNSGFYLVLWMAALSRIPRETMEAAMMDGADACQRMRFILLPQLKGSFAGIILLAVLHLNGSFREVSQVTGEYPESRIFTLQYLLNNWFSALEVDKIAAGAVLYSIPFIALVLLVQHLWNRKESFHAE